MSHVVVNSVLIVDDNAMIRKLLCELFTSQAEFQVCGQAGDGREAIKKAQELEPDLMVMDLSMAMMSGLEAARVLKRLMPAMPVELTPHAG
jgi:chemotaxis response regulator CheB